MTRAPEGRENGLHALKNPAAQTGNVCISTCLPPIVRQLWSPGRPKLTKDPHTRPGDEPDHLN
jgi:hypothetical protein